MWTCRLNAYCIFNVVKRWKKVVFSWKTLKFYSTIDQLRGQFFPWTTLADPNPPVVHPSTGREWCQYNKQDWVKSITRLSQLFSSMGTFTLRDISVFAQHNPTFYLKLTVSKSFWCRTQKLCGALHRTTCQFLHNVDLNVMGAQVKVMDK